MHKLLLVFGVVALLSSAVVLLHHKRGKEVTPEGVDQFYQWKCANSKNYASIEENQYRMAIFYENLIKIQAHNQLPDVEYTMAVNQFADLTSHEFKETYLGYGKHMKNYQPTDNWMVVNSNVQVPASVNWVTAGDVTPVKNQGQCGSCWAFSTTGSLEGCSAIFGSGLQSFSEQQLVDCSTSYGNQGCNGGVMDYAFKYVIANGITTESAYPYTGVQGKCKVNGGAFKIKSYTNVPKANCNSLQVAVAKQPTSVAVDAANWQLYSTGIFSNCGTSLDHGVLVAGYTSTYWLVKNSWGTSWGMQGYIELKFGNTCGVCNQASYPNL